MHEQECEFSFKGEISSMCCDTLELLLCINHKLALLRQKAVRRTPGGQAPHNVREWCRASQLVAISSLKYPERA